MQEYIEKKIYVYRKSYKYYGNISTAFLISKCLVSASGLSAFVFLPLASLSLGAAIIQIIEDQFHFKEQEALCKKTFQFYIELLNIYQQGEEDILKFEESFLQTVHAIPREKYLKQMGLNGYKYKSKL